jgi:Tat protein secretion system quality control protein TatD with DNase activity
MKEANGIVWRVDIEGMQSQEWTCHELSAWAKVFRMVRKLGHTMRVTCVSHPQYWFEVTPEYVAERDRMCKSHGVRMIGEE